MAGLHRSSRHAHSSQQEKVAVTSILGENQPVPAIGGNAAVDDETLGALGYKQEFKR